MFVQFCFEGFGLVVFGGSLDAQGGDDAGSRPVGARSTVLGAAGRFGRQVAGALTELLVTRDGLLLGSC